MNARIPARNVTEERCSLEATVLLLSGRAWDRTDESDNADSPIGKASLCPAPASMIGGRGERWRLESEMRVLS